MSQDKAHILDIHNVQKHGTFLESKCHTYQGGLPVAISITVQPTLLKKMSWNY